MVTLGADPELFVLDQKRRIISPMCGVLPGTKENPFQMDNGYAVQWDNVMLEYNIPPESAEQGGEWTRENTVMFLAKIQEGAIRALNVAKKVTNNPNLVYSPNASATFTAATLRKNFGELPFSFGCSPEFSVELRGGQVPVIRADDPFWTEPSNANKVTRFAGGHIHIGYDNPDNVPPWVVAGLCDIFVKQIAEVFGNGGRRAQHYGRPGRFRPTSYGIEYRTPSADWVATAVTRKKSRYSAPVGTPIGAYNLIEAAVLVGKLVECVPAQLLADCFRTVYPMIATQQPNARIHTRNVKQWFAQGAHQHGAHVVRAIEAVELDSNSSEARQRIEDAMEW